MAEDMENVSRRADKMLEAQIRDLLVSELGTQAFDHLMEMIPPEQAISSIRKYTLYSGTAASANARRRFGLEGNGPEEVIMPLYWLHAGTSHENYNPPEVRERGVVFEHYSCPLSRARPEVCISISHYCAEGICRSMNPELEYIFTHHLTNGDGRCRYIVRKKGEGRSFEDLGQLVRVMPRIELTEEEKEYFGDHSIIDMIVVASSVTRDLGLEEEMLTSLEPTLNALGKRLALFLENELMGELDGKDGMLRAVGICQRSMMMRSELDGPIDMEQVTGKVTSCPFQDAPVLACKEFERVMNGVCEVLLPDHEFVYGEMMSKGDEKCTWSLRRKSSGLASETNSALTKEEDPIKVLSLRLARGEISEEEYERKAQLILKHYLKV
jgi:hypothetical protein